MRTSIPKRIRNRVLSLAGGLCELCGTVLTQWHCDHVTAHFYVNEHALENLQALCPPCHAIKTKIDMGQIAKVRRMAMETGQQARRARRGHGLIRSRPFDKTLSKKMDGTVIRK